MNRPERKGKERIAGYAACVLAGVFSLIFRIPLFYIIGEKGIAYFSIANELYVAAGCIFTYGLLEAVSALVRYRVKREQFRNAGRVLKVALLLAAIAGILLGFLFIFTGNIFTKRIAGVPLSGMAVSMVALAVVFQMLTGVFRGYFEGNGSRMPSMHSLALKTLFLMSLGLFFATMLHKYGEKVSALLQNEDYAASYGAMGACIGILAASVLGFLHLLLLYFLYRGNIRKQVLRDFSKNQDGGAAIFHMLIGTAAPFAAYAVLFRVIPFFDGIFFIRMAGEGIDAVSVWGSYYGKYLVVIGIISLLLILGSGGSQIKRIIYHIDREEFRTAREKTAALIHQTALISVPIAIFTAVLSENLLNLLYKGNNKDTAVLVTLGSILIVLSVFSNLFAGILIQLKRMKYVILYEAIAFAVHVMLVPALLTGTKLSISAVIIGNIVSFAILMIFGFVMVSRALQYRQEWIHTAAFTIICGAIAGLLVMLLNKGISSLAGTTIAFAICFPLGIIIYMVLLVVTRAVTEEELINMPLGGILLWLGRWMRFM